MDSRPKTIPALLPINDVTPRGADDDPLFAHLRAVLEQHGALSRFGITLLHQHFQVADDELLVEECDPLARTLTLQPRSRTDLARRHTIATSWRLDVADEQGQQTACCVWDPDAEDHVKRVGECPDADQETEDD